MAKYKIKGKKITGTKKKDKIVSTGKGYDSVSDVLAENDATDVETLIGKFNTVNNSSNWTYTG